MKKYPINLHTSTFAKWLMGGLLLAGVILGILASQVLNEQIRTQLGQELMTLTPQDEGVMLSLNILESNTWEIIKLYLCGLCLIGVILIPLYSFFKGFSFGFTCSFFITQNPWANMLIPVIAVIIPQALLLPVIFGVTILTFKMSIAIFYMHGAELFKEILRLTVFIVGLLLLSGMISFINGELISRVL